jgi:hypothetical protein
MEVSISNNYTKKPWGLGKLKKLCEGLAEIIGANIEDIRIGAKRRLDDRTSADVTYTIDEVSTIIKIDQDINQFSLFFRNKEIDFFFLIISYKDHYRFSFDTEGDKLQNVIELSENLLELEEYVSQESKKLSDSDLVERIERLEQLIESKNSLKCFLSYRFTEYSKSLVFELTRFLDLVGIEVVSGINYEPRRISQKVTDKLNENFDFFIYLVTSEFGESMWIRDELITTYNKEKPIIPIIEIGAKFEPGILSDWEYIPFSKGDISKTYIGILEALKYIKLAK